MTQKFSAPTTVRNQADIFCFTFGMRATRSAALCRPPDFAASLRRAYKTIESIPVPSHRIFRH